MAAIVIHPSVGCAASVVRRIPMPQTAEWMTRQPKDVTWDAGIRTAMGGI